MTPWQIGSTCSYRGTFQSCLDRSSDRRQGLRDIPRQEDSDRRLPMLGTSHPRVNEPACTAVCAPSEKTVARTLQRALLLNIVLPPISQYGLARIVSAGIYPVNQPDVPSKHARTRRC